MIIIAKLPIPTIEKIEVTWSERAEEQQKIFFTMIGQAIRKAEMANKEKGGKGKDETD
ncbi:hypothetical protein [Tepidimicrobium xylanilyticum]|uniref:Uncharacterized protein n=1 Tax=Tepidimicrobium xylanilyticum TaxID=1123352 RepID=A0A1H2YK42_9FIRM|nr:hypothetical protein [Tepidimicrobium xylanilyticum]SDX05450.1 hypothetical protein SAMN05660923_01643 [Tepidimicrobium xylanilyticum]